MQALREQASRGKAVILSFNPAVDGIAVAKHVLRMFHCTVKVRVVRSNPSRNTHGNGMCRERNLLILRFAWFRLIYWKNGCILCHTWEKSIVHVSRKRNNRIQECDFHRSMEIIEPRKNRASVCFVRSEGLSLYG